MSAHPAPPPPPSPSAPPPAAKGAPEGRIAVVVNGNAKSVTSDVIATLDQILAGGDLFVSRHLDEVDDIARTLVDRGYGTVLTGGGDGTFTVVVSAVVREADRRRAARPRFGLLRLGTGNSLAWVVGASPASRAGKGLAADIQRLREDAGSRPMRFIEVEGFVAPFCGFGVDAIVLRDYGRTKEALSRGPLRRYAPGALSYVVSSVTQSIPSYVFRPVPHCRVVNLGADAYRVGERGAKLGAPVRAGEVLYEGRARLVACGSIPYYGFGFRMFPYADDRPDRMHLRVAVITSAEFVANFPAIWRGEYENLETVFDYLVEAVRVEMDPPTPFQIGGDPRGDRGEVTLRLQQEPLELVDYYAPPRG
ncbi:MAG TPA: diacylglycerol kinase family protein [Polyangiaceae bacterium]|nr:diacylglycerol kinase family protein [Polyangiaceae bacterium]